MSNSSSTPGPQLVTFHHQDFKKDFKNLAGTKQETREDLALVRDGRRCHLCGVIGGDKLKTCNKCKFTQYCSRDCQVEDWPKHKADCRAPLVMEKGGLEEAYPDLAMKFATRVPACPLLMFHLQKYAIESMSLLTDFSKATTHMLRITVSTSPADILLFMASMTQDHHTQSSYEVMLKFAKLEVVPMDLTPAMSLEITELRIKLDCPSPGPLIVALMFTNGVKNFFCPTLIAELSYSVARKREPIVFKSRFSGDKVLPFGEESLQEVMNNFVLMDKKNQFKLRAIPK